MSYNPYNGKNYELKDLKEKSKKMNEKEKKNYKRKISFEPKHLLEDTYETLQRILSPNFSLYELNDAQMLKGLGFFIVVICSLSLLLTFL
uniref:Uncharacterized protein n=1 Tax=viral metagenome TaxID=1070528 RepID=A0A6C0F8W0_9ZZZZ|tara:strand:- start:22184 stop:22453 length:270 start_codon:yes stop_codon:yes gene_type:complete